MKNNMSAIELNEKSIEVIRSNRRTISVEVREDASIIVRAPFPMKDRDIQQFLNEKSTWIMKHVQAVRDRQTQRMAQGLSPTLQPFTEAEIRRLKDEAARDFAVRVKKYEPIMGVRSSKVSIRHQKTRWGSCSRKGNLNFNCILMLCPEEVRDYVVVHELAHLKVMNHSPRFWDEVEMILPKYRTARRWLKEKGGEIIQR